MKVPFYIYILLLAAQAEGATLRGRLVGEGSLEGAVVWVDGGEKLPPAEAKTRAPEMSQLDKKFSPNVLAVRAGDSVSFPNRDNVFHNVFSLDKDNPFDLGLFKGKQHFDADGKPSKGGRTSQPFKKPGKFMIFCNIHPDMTGSVFAFAHGYFAQADADGLFELPRPPKGRHTLVVGGPTLDKLVRREIEVGDGVDAVEVELSARSAPKKVAHTKKDGTAYPEDYR